VLDSFLNKIRASFVVDLVFDDKDTFRRKEGLLYVDFQGA
jgi:hypothetical protein